jgi:hypothetical protein
MTARNAFYISSLLMLPLLYVLFITLHVGTQGQPMEHGCRAGTAS